MEEESTKKENLKSTKPVVTPTGPTVTNIPKSDRFWKISTAILIVLLAIFAFRGSFSENTTNPTGAIVQDDTQAAAPAVDMALAADDIVKGSANAPITIIEYSDPSCPFCAAAAGKNQQVIDYLKSRDPSWEAPVPKIIKNYVDTGKVKLVFRYFPGHGKGAEAMKIMFCANEQGKFWEIHDVMFDNQAKMEAGDTAGLKKLAADNGVDSGKLEACLAANKYDAKLAKDTQLGQAAGVGGTPSFAINGQLVEGAVSFGTIQVIIEKALR